MLHQLHTDGINFPGGEWVTYLPVTDLNAAGDTFSVFLITFFIHLNSLNMCQCWLFHKKGNGKSPHNIDMFK